MSPRSAARPGAGFAILLLAILGSLAFFCWGLATPPLDDVWRLQIELNLGRKGALSEREFRLMQDTLVRWPDLARSLLDDADAGFISANSGGVVSAGFAYLVRRHPGPPATLLVTRMAGEPAQVTARTLGASSSGGNGGDTLLSWRLPDDGAFPQLVEVRISGDAGAPATAPVLARLLP